MERQREELVQKLTHLGLDPENLGKARLETEVRERELPWLQELAGLLERAEGFPQGELSSTLGPEELATALRKALLEAEKLAGRTSQMERALDLARMLEEARRELLSARFARLRKSEALKKDLEVEVRKLQEQAERLGVLAYRHLLRPGEPCPLCEGMVHVLPQAKEAPEVQALREELESLKRRLGAVEAEARELAQSLAGLEDPGLAVPPDRAKELEVEVGRCEGALAEILDQFGLDRKAPSEAIARWLEEARGAWEAVRARVGGIAGALVRYLDERLEGRELEAYAAEVQKRKELLAGLEVAWRALEEQARELSTARVVSTVLVEERQKAVEESRRRVEGLPPKEVLQGKLLPFEEEQAILRDWEGYQTDLEAKRREVERCRRDLEALAPLPEPLPTRAHLGALDEEVRTLRERERQVDMMIGRLTEARDQVAQRLERRAKVEQSLKDLRETLDRLEPLAEDLEPKAFPNWLYGRLQKSLLERANRLLQELSLGQYRLHTEGDAALEYRVLDLWNGVSRSADTLSGGEAFLASLALALALSEELAGTRLEALFLDEGFGTLDGETLERVAGALERLGRQGRMLGIVTHVGTLAERFPNRLRVYKVRGESEARWEV